MSKSTTLSNADFESLVEEARRAPSAHNTQPARWHFEPLETGLRVHLLGDPTRHLPHADPTGRDDRLSLGAAFEGMSLALSSRGLALTNIRFDANEMFRGLHTIVSADLIEGKADPLAENVATRASWRGVFGPSQDGDVQALEDALAHEGDVLIVSEQAAIASLAKQADAASRTFLRQPAYFAELFHWLRFSNSHPNWNRDGLNSDAMALSGIERILGSLFMRPWVFRLLGWLRLDGLLTSEASQTCSSSAIALLYAPNDEDPFDTGRRFYRVWLRMESVELVGCPLSSLADDEATAERVSARFSIPHGHRLVNAFRIGRPPSARSLPLSARLPTNELIVK